MNPLLLLLGLLGASAFAAGGKGGDDATSLDKTLSKPDDDDEDSGGSSEDGASEPVMVEAPASAPPTSSPSTPPSAPASPPPPADLPDEITVPTAPEQAGGTGEDGGSTTPISVDGTTEVMTGRVSTLSLSDTAADIQSVRIISDVNHGHVTVNPDNTLALVLTNTFETGSDSLTYEVTHSDGSTSTHDVALNVIPGVQAAGWATGTNHYMLETDADDRVVVEHGDTHVKVFATGASDAWTISKIAAAEGLSESDITGKWLAEHDYGLSEDKALDEDAARMLWERITPEGKPTSNWFLYERGHDYDGDVWVHRDLIGEDELHPVYFGAWGEGADPVVKGFFKLGDGNENVVVQGLAFEGGIELKSSGGNALLDDLHVSGNEMVVMYYDAVTVRGSQFFDIHHDEPILDSEGLWATGGARVSGIFANYNGGLLLEDNIFDLNGWEVGYDPGRDADYPQPPSMFSHNIYLGDDNVDVTLRDTISMRAASIGAMIRTGGYIEDNIMIDNNIGMNTLGGNYKGTGPVDSYTLFQDNVVTSAGYKEADAIGGLSTGLGDKALMTSLVDNIVAHLADPNNPDEFMEKYWTYDALKTEDNYYDDTIVWNWAGARTLERPKDYDQNHEGLDKAVLDQTTIQLFTAELLGKSDATIADLGDYLRAQASGAFDDVVDADLIIRFFQEGFGISPDIRGDAETLRFVPNDLGDGVRWDNRLNWTTDDLPGTRDGDSVDLGGNHVVFGTNARIENMDMGPDGKLLVYGGKLSVDGDLDGTGELNIDGAGQLWIDDAGDASGIDLAITGGRFANTGEVSGLDLAIGNGQAILAADDARFEVADGQTLALFDAAAKVGFDGEDGGVAVLDFDKGSTLSYSATAGDLNTISEFRSGAFGDAPDVLSGIDLQGATLEIDLDGLDAAAGTSFTLMEADEIAGVLKAAQIDNLGSYDARLVVDYETDAVRLELTSGSGKVSVDTIGAQGDIEDGHDALWNALTADHGVASESAWAGDDETEVLDAA